MPGNPIVIVGHGNGEKIDDYFKYGVDKLYSAGLSLCIVDYRGYGYSDGKYGTASATEREDIIEVYNYLKSHGFERISYFGRSLGATCGIFLAAQCQDLVCLALDSPWMSTKEWCQYIAQQFHKINSDKFEEILPSVYEKILKEFKIDFNQVEDPRVAATKITQPFYLIHGSFDKLVPLQNSEELIGLVQSREKHFEPFESDHNLRDEYCFEGIYDFIISQNNIKV